MTMFLRKNRRPSTTSEPADESAAITGMPGAERRREERTAVELKAVVAHWEHSYFVDVLDFSNGGCRARKPPNWKLPLQVQVRLYVVFGADDVRSVQARVAWINDDIMGLEFLANQRPA
jgi:hypothetical protein